MNSADTPKRGELLRLGGDLVTVETGIATETGVDLILWTVDGKLVARTVTWEQLEKAHLPVNDGLGDQSKALAGLWGRWMQYTSPRLRSAALATRPLERLAHQDEAVFDHMLPQPRLRFLLADEPGTGKTIMTGMYLVEGRRRGLIPGPAVVVVPAHLLQKWEEELEDFFGIRARVLTPDVARDPQDLDPRIEVWVTSVDLYTRNPDVRRKVSGANASWSLAVFDEAHRLTPTSRYLAAAQELASRSHHLLLLTATPHRGKEHYFRGLCNLLDPVLYPWDPDIDHYECALRPSRMSFLRRMKEDLLKADGTRLFPERYAETLSVTLGELERAAYESVMDYAERWYGENSTLALSIYGKRAASCLPAVCATLERRLASVSGSARRRGLAQVPNAMAEGLRGDRVLTDAFEDPDELAQSEDVIVGAATHDKQREIKAIHLLLDQLHAAIELGGTPAKWRKAEEVLDRHGIAPGKGQLLLFTEFADTARWLQGCFEEAGYSVRTLEGAVDHKQRHELQRGFLAGEFQVLVSTDAGGEGINLQSAHVMLDWDIPWSLVRLEQRMGRLHRIGQKHDVFIYHLVAPDTREGRVQEVMLQNIEAAADSLGGRIFDLLDATMARAFGVDFDFAQLLSRAQVNPDTTPSLPNVSELKRAGEALVNEDKYLRTKVDHVAADSRFRADRLESINPVIVDGFIDALSASQGWTAGPGPAFGIRRLRSERSLPSALGGGTSKYIAADGAAVHQALADGITDLEDVTVLGPTEDVFSELILLAIEVGRPELLRGANLVDTSSLTDYTLLIYEAEVRMHDGVRQVSRPAPIIVRWSGAGAFEVSWESLMSLKPGSGPAIGKPTPGQLVEAEDAARAALIKEVQRQKSERLGWVAKAREQLNELEDRFIEETEDLPKVERQARQGVFAERKLERLAQLNELEDVQPTAVRQIGWAHVEAGVTIDELGYEPNAEKVAIAKVLAELEALGYSVDDRQTAGVGYDLLARHKSTSEQRLVEVKGFTETMGAVWLEQNEWAQALQRRGDYWLYVVEECAQQPTIKVRVQDPVDAFGEGANQIQRFLIKLSQLKAKLQQ